MTCPTCGGDRYAPEPPERLASVRYQGRHPEPSITFPVPCPGLTVVPFEDAVANFTGVGSHRNEIVVMPNGRWRERVSVWAAVFLMGARQRHGPWVQVRISPGAWAEVRSRAPWLRKASDGVRLMNPEFVEQFRACEVNEYVVGPLWASLDEKFVNRLVNSKGALCLSITGAARVLGVSRQAVSQMVKAGQLPVERYALGGGHGVGVISMAAVQAWKRIREARVTTPFGGYTITFANRVETMEQVFGTSPLTPAQMTKALWAFVKAQGLGR